MRLPILQSGGRSVRAFVAIELEAPCRKALARMIERLDDGSPGLRWVRPEQLHLTLRFLGDIPELEAPEITDLLDELADSNDTFDIEVKGIGCFPAEGPERIIWAGLDEPDGRLARLQRDVAELFSGEGFKQEHRAFTPHITLARVKDRPPGGLDLRKRVSSVGGGFRGGISHVNEIVLFQSSLGRGGPKYLPLSRHILGGGDHFRD